MLSNLPPGVTDKMIDKQCNGRDDTPYCSECGEDLNPDGTCPDCLPENDEENDIETPLQSEEDTDIQYFHQRDEESESYRSSMIDAGRGHLLR